MPKKAVIYVRVSDIKQLDGVSLGHQEEKTRKYMELEDYVVVKVFREEGRSAKDQWRDEFQNMMKYIRENRDEVDAVCFYALSRLGRNVRLVLETIDQLSRMKVAMYSYSEKLDTTSSSGKFTLHILSALAQLESDQIRERVMPNMKYSVENEGRWMGARYVPYGYKSTMVENVGGLGTEGKKKSRKMLVVVPEEAEQVRLIFDLYCDGIGNDVNAGGYKITKHLNKGGYRYRDGSEWTSKRVSDILYNGHLYAGYLKWNRKGSEYKIIEQTDEDGNTIEKYQMSKRTKSSKPVRVSFNKPESEVAFGKGIHEAIIAEGKWQLSEKKLERKRNDHKQDNLDLTRVAKNLFTHILVCPTCKGSMGATHLNRTNAKGDKITDVYYKCQKAARGENCNHNMINEVYIKDSLLDIAFKYYRYYISYRARNLIMEQLTYNDGLKSDEELAVQTLHIELAAVQTKIDSLYLDYKYNEKSLVPDEDTYLRILSKLTDQKNDIQRKLHHLEEQEKQTAIDLNEIKVITGRLKEYDNIHDYFESLSDEGKINLIEKVFHEVHFTKFEGKKGRHSFQFDKIVMNYSMFMSPFEEDDPNFDALLENEALLEKYEQALKQINILMDSDLGNAELAKSLVEIGHNYPIAFYDEQTGKIREVDIEYFFEVVLGDNSGADDNDQKYAEELNKFLSASITENPFV